MSMQTPGALRIQGFKGIFGAPGLGQGRCGHPHHGQGLLMMTVQGQPLTGLPLDFQPTGSSVRACDLGPGLGRLQTSPGEIERIPAEAQTPPGHDHKEDEQDKHNTPPSGRRQDSRQGRPLHGKTFRFSSKWGPSRRRGQSPPQTTGVCSRTDAALNAAAMRG